MKLFKNNKEKKERIYKSICVLIMTVVIFMGNVQYAFASTDYGQNIETWIVSQVKWLALAALVIVILVLLSKKAWMALIGVIIGGGLAVYFIANPTKIQDIGEKLAGVFLK